MEYIDLKAQYQRLKPQIDQRIAKVIAESHYIMGPEVAELEQRLAGYVGRKYCVSCSNGTDAMAMLLMAWEVGPGDAVFVPSFTFMATAEVANLRGATPVFVDIDLDTFNIDPDALEEAICRVEQEGKLRPQVVIAVDLYGLPADYGRIARTAERHGLKLIEDGAQGFGGTIGDRKACSFGDASTTSFFPAKPLGCYGDGGAVFVDDPQTAGLLTSIRAHGKGQEKYDNVRVGLNARLDTIQAAILLVKLDAFEAFELQARHRAAAVYTDRLKGVVHTPVIPEGFTSSYAQYTLLLEDGRQRDTLRSSLAARGIPTMVYYPKPLHLQSVYQGMGNASLPNSEQAAERVLSLPMHPYLEEEQINQICASIRETLAITS